MGQIPKSAHRFGRTYANFNSKKSKLNNPGIMHVMTHTHTHTQDDSSGSDAEGDFEDMETGEKFGGSSGDAVTDAAMKAIREAEAEDLRAKKAAQKAAFNAQV